MRTAELSGATLDYWVAKAEGMATVPDGWAPSTNWAQGGPILERENILVGKWRDRGFAACVEEFTTCAVEVDAFGATYLEAGMRCRVKTAFGLNVPDHPS